MAPSHLRHPAPALRALLVVAAGAALAVSLALAPAFARSDWSPGPMAVGTSTFDGYIDLPAAGASISAGAPFLVGGWVVDTSAEGWAGVDDVHVYLGKAGEGGVFLTRGLVAQSRPDVGAALGNPYWSASGFSATVPGSAALPQGAQTLSVYAHTPGKGWWYKQVTVTVTQATATATPAPAATTTTAVTYSDDPLVRVMFPIAGTSFGTVNEVEIKGFALDRNVASGKGTGVDRVQIYLDGKRGSGAAHNLGDATLGETYGNGGDYGSQFVAAGWGLAFTPTQYAAGEHTLYVYARSSVSGNETLVEVPFELYEGE